MWAQCYYFYILHGNWSEVENAKRDKEQVNNKQEHDMQGTEDSVWLVILSFTRACYFLFCLYYYDLIVLQCRLLYAVFFFYYLIVRENNAWVLCYHFCYGKRVHNMPCMWHCMLLVTLSFIKVSVFALCPFYICIGVCCFNTT